MKRKAAVLVVIVLAFSGIGAKRRSVGPQPQCAMLTPNNAFIRFAGSVSGCTNGNGTACQMGEVIIFDIMASGYDVTCAPHQVQMSFGDKTSSSRNTTTTFPTFVHSYEAIGGYAVEATINNGRGPAKLTQGVMVEGPIY